MTDMLKTGFEHLQDQMKAHASRAVTYVRGSAIVAIRASVGRTPFEFDTDDGMPLSFESRDFLVHRADLILSGSVTDPRPGDRIRETDGDTVYVYEVMAPGTEPCFRPSGTRRRLRIHTKLVATENT